MQFGGALAINEATAAVSNTRLYWLLAQMVTVCQVFYVYSSALEIFTVLLGIQ
jgi:hypothetical protein